MASYARATGRCRACNLPAGHYASCAGTAPIKASSGDVRRHRLCRSGNRSLNNALHLAARVQAMHTSLGHEHYQRKLGRRIIGKAMRRYLN